MKTNYPTNLTDNQRRVIEKVINPQESARKYSLREILSAILFINKNRLPVENAPIGFRTLADWFYYFRKWKLEGVFEDIMDTLHALVRKLVGRDR